MLILSLILCAEGNMPRKTGTIKESERAKIFSSLICRDKIRSAIRHASEQGKERVLMRNKINKKTEVLLAKL